MPSLIIKFSTDTPDLALEVPDPTIVNVSWLRNQVRQKVGGVLVNRRLRFIAAGKVLTEHTNFARDVAKVDIKGKKPIVASNNGTPSGFDPTKRIYVHCSVGDILSPADLQREATLDLSSSTPNPESSTEPAPRGFDRLRNAGFTTQDIEQLRNQFQRTYGNDDNDEEDGERDIERQEGRQAGEPVPVLGGAAVVNGVERGNRLRMGIPSNNGANNSNVTGASEENNQMVQMEELWLDTTINDQSPVMSLGGDYLDDLIGLIVGMFLGVLVLFAIKEPRIFSQRQRKSVIAGVLINIVFAALRRFALYNAQRSG